jgi:hypothetical protein
MIICHKKQFVVLAPWKTASQTIRHRLSSHNESEYSPFFYFNKYLNRVVHQHITRADFACFPEASLNYYIAAFVRNPYDRVYSGFRQLQRDIKRQPHNAYPETWIRELVMKQLAENLAQLSRANFQFDAWFALVGEEQINESGRNSNFPLHPVHYWTHIADRHAVNFIGKVENFEKDFERLLSTLKIHEVNYGNHNVSDVQERGPHNPFGYRYVHLMNTESIKKINKLFAKDFELFGYEQVS